MKLVFVPVTVLMLLFCIATFGSKGADHPKGGYCHVVIFKLNADAPKGYEQTFLTDCERLLGKIPSVRYFTVGRKATKTTRDLAPVPPQDFHIALLARFDDFDGLKAYVAHKNFKDFADLHDKNTANLEALPVYDFEMVESE